MNTPQPPNPDTPSSLEIDQYLDDVMAPQERAAFESRLQSDAALAAHVEKVRRENAALALAVHAQFTLPSGDDLVASIHRAARSGDSSTRRITPVASNRSWLVTARWVAIAATLLLCIGGGLLFQRLQSQARVNTQHLLAYYSEQVRLGLTPQWVCKDDKTFREYTAMRFGAPLTFKTPPAGVALIGWTYVRGPMRTDTNAVLIATQDNTPILILVEKRAGAPRVDAGAEPAKQQATRIFRKDLAAVSLYELTPLNSPTVIDLLEQAD